MYEQRLSDLEYISQKAGSTSEYVQGGGGNTSVKLDNELMAIKASGFALKQVTERSGFAVVNYKNIYDYYDNLNDSNDPGEQEESKALVGRNTVVLPGMEKLRPSVEAGFHSLLDRYVIHTHSVYANILCCSEEGHDLANRLFGKGMPFVWVPYVNPGFSLTVEIRRHIEERLQQGGLFPCIFFMQNHGMIVTGSSGEECVNRHEQVNSIIREYFELHEDYPETKLEKTGDNEYRSLTANIVQFFAKSGYGLEYFEKYVLYPDQLVYLNANTTAGEDKKPVISLEQGNICYRTGSGNARTIDETLAAFLFVTFHIRESGLKLSMLSKQDIDFITGWEGEKYRRSIAEKQQ